MELIERLERIERDSLARLATLDDPPSLEQWRLDVLGRKGHLAEAMQCLGALPAGDRPKVGKRANAAKLTLEAAFSSRLRDASATARARELEGERIDVTLPGRAPTKGSLHPVTKIRREVE